MDKKITEYAKAFIKSIPQSTLNRVNNSVNMTVGVLRIANEKELNSYIINNNLTNPNNLAKFMVKVHIEQMTSIHEGFYNIKADYKNEWKSMLESAGDKFEYALNNSQKKEQELDAARRQVMDCIRVFKNDVIQHIEEIRKIDNQPEPKFILSSVISLIRCDKEVKFASDTIKRLMEAYKLLFIITSNSKDDNSSLIDNFYENKNQIMLGDNCLLMANYCKNKEDRDFWCGLSDLWDDQKKLFGQSIEIFNSEKKSEISFWDD